MTDPRIQKLADVLVNHSTKVKPGDWVWLSASMAAEPLANAVFEKVIEAGGNCTTTWGNEAMNEAYFRKGNDEQLKWVSPTLKMLYEEADVLISLDAAFNTRSLSSVDPERQKMRGIATRHLSEIYAQRSADGDLDWVIAQFPCPALAQEADMSLRDFEDFVYGATFCDKDDPVAEWLRIHDEQEKIVQWLAGKKTVTVKSPNADLTLSIEGRPFINADGTKNMPSGEVFTSPVEDSTNGWVNFTYPAIRAGREVEGIRLVFKDGKVVEATAEKNEDYLLAMLDSDEGARYLGEFAIGTNYGIQQFTKSILFDEKIGGSFHMAVGFGFPEANSQNKSAIHWDMICDVREDSEIRVDGELLYKDGQFVID